MFSRFSLKSVLLISGLLMIPVFGYLWWPGTPTLDTLTNQYGGVGGGVKRDFQSLPTLPLSEEKDSFTLTDNTSDGIDIRYASQSETPLLGTETPKLNLTFPKDYSQPIEVKLDDKRTVSITDLSGKSNYQVEALGQEAFRTSPESTSFFQSLFPKKEQTPQTYLRYTSDDERKSLLYAYQKDQASGEKKLKHWTLYESGDGIEQESYRIENAKVKVNSEGVAEGFYYTEQDLKNDQVATEVDSNLLARAQRTLAREMGEDLLNGNKVPDFTIPKPYYIDSVGEKHDAEWRWSDETNTLSVSFSPTSYPVALDPTLSFTAPGMSNTGSVITANSGSRFSTAMVAADFNTDGRADLAVSEIYINNYSGRVYLFYSDNTFPTQAAGADKIIDSSTQYVKFGSSLGAGDLNADGRVDLIVGTDLYDQTSTGQVKIFYNDGSIPTTSASADITITGDGTNKNFGTAITTGDFNADGTIDLAVGAMQAISVQDGRAYIFYNDGSIPTTAGTADVTITGETSGWFGSSVAAGDLNSDGRTDFIVGATRYSSDTGRAYIFYNDGSIPTTAGTADVTITGESGNFATSLVTGDFNFDGKPDLAASASGYGAAYYGRVYIFHGDGSIPTAASSADVTITGSANYVQLGQAMNAADYNSDGRTDLAIGAYGYFNTDGAIYIYYNDGLIPTGTTSADVVITAGTGGGFGYSLTSADFNTDGKVDLAVGAVDYGTSSGRAYIFYSQNGQVNTNFSIAGNATGDQFGYALATGDLNSDGRTDLIVGANAYSTSTGRAYIFYGDGQIPTTAGSADVTITGNATSDEFGKALVTGDFDADGDTDLAVGAPGYSTNTGRVYLFYNDSSIPTTAGTADVTITGEATSNYFGYALAAGPLKTTNKKTDLVVGAYGYSTNDGRVYIFYNGSIITESASGADVTISSSNTDYYIGQVLGIADLDADGDADLAINGDGQGGGTGFIYLFYNDGSIPTTTGSADVTISNGSTYDLAGSLAFGDFNSDGRVDIAAGSVTNGFGSYEGYVRIFYNDGAYSNTADVTITGESASSQFGVSVVAGDFNADGRTDLAVGASAITTNTGKAHIFYNDGSIPTTAATADVIITGETTNNYFGYAMTAGDMNGDGRSDLVVGARGYNTGQGRLYFYETRENFAWQIQKQPTSSGITRTGLNTTGQEIQITGQSASQFGFAMTTGDFNGDGKKDLAVGANSYDSSTGRVYIFYNDGDLPTTTTSADVIIQGGTTSDEFGDTMIAGDFNADGKTDLAVSSYMYSNKFGRVYVFYNDGSYPATANSADVIFTGDSILTYFGWSLAAGDFNADGTIDLAVGAYKYASSAGRIYIFYNDGSYPAPASADVIIAGEASSRLGTSLVAGDFNADGETDIASGAQGYSSFAGRVYIFHNDGSIPTTAATADVIITGEASSELGDVLVAGDFNFDSTVDLASSAINYSSSTGRAYIFHNDGSIPTTASTADVIITGETASDSFSWSLTSGDWNADGRTDLAVGALGYSSSAGRVYIFNNDGSIPTTGATADIILTGDASSVYGYTLNSGDFNTDGKADLVVASVSASSSAGRVYIYTFNDPVITGGASSDFFGYALASADLNADGRTDLAVGAYDADSMNGRVYLFYNDGALPGTATTADVIITGSDMFAEFGSVLAVGDWNADGRTDLATSAVSYDFFGSTGRVYLFYNDGTIPTTSGGADVTITGEASGNSFGYSLTSADFSGDGKTDLAVGAAYYNPGGAASTGRAYVFYGDGSIPTTGGTADVIISGEAASSLFGYALTKGDFNADGRADLVVGAAGYNPGGAASTGRAYVFYGDGSIPTTGGTADVIISGDAAGDNFGIALATGDLNVDGRSDLVVSAQSYTSSTGRVYILYGDGSLPTTAATADVTITGDATNDVFGSSLVTADWNADGRTDLAVGARGYTSFTGRVYTFNNDGSYPTTAATADSVVTGVTASDNFGRSLTVGDWNTDGRVDLAVGASGYSSNKGQVYIFTSEVTATSTPPGTFYMKGTGKLKGTGKIK